MLKVIFNSILLVSLTHCTHTHRTPAAATDKAQVPTDACEPMSQLSAVNTYGEGRTLQYSFELGEINMLLDPKGEIVIPPNASIVTFSHNDLNCSITSDGNKIFSDKKFTAVGPKILRSKEFRIDQQVGFFKFSLEVAGQPSTLICLKSLGGVSRVTMSHFYQWMVLRKNDFGKSLDICTPEIQSGELKSGTKSEM